MSERPTLTHSATLGRQRRPVTPEQSSDLLTLVRQRAQQASQFYNSVGLSNGDLPRDPNAKRWSDSISVDRKNDLLSAPSTSPAWSTQSLKSPTNFRPRWVTPAPEASGQVKDKPVNDIPTYKTLPRKERTKEFFADATLSQPRPRSSSHSADEAPPATAHEGVHTASNSETLHPVNFNPNVNHVYDVSKTNSLERFHTVPRNANDKRRKSGPSARSLEPTVGRSQHANDVEIPVPAPRVHSHLYTTQLSNRKTGTKPSGVNNAYSIPSSKGNKQDSPNHASTSQHQSPVRKTDRAASSLDSSPRRSPVLFDRSGIDTHKEAQATIQHALLKSYDFKKESEIAKQRRISREFGSSSSLDDARGTDVVDSKLIEMMQEYRKNKSASHTRSSSPSAKHMRRNQAEPGLPDSERVSAKHRRPKDKYRSKSDVPDHKTLLNKLQSMEKEREKEADDFLIKDTDLTFEQMRKRRHHFAHYDWQSMLFSFKDVLIAMDTLKRKNTTTGASKAAALAAAASTDSLASKASSNNGSQEDISIYLDEDEGLENNRYNDLVASCPFFRNEVGGEKERVICVSASSGISVQVGNHTDESTTQAQNVLSNRSYVSVVELGDSDKLLPPGTPANGSVSFGIEQVDRGACYYRTYFYEKDHQNFFGMDDKFGPVVISLRREKLEDTGSGAVYQYRVIMRTCELCTLRGSILEDAVSSARHHPNKGYPAKDVLEYICPELNMSQLKVAVATPKVHEQIMKVDEQNVQEAYKIGVLYCKAGQTTEEDMYNNEHGSDAFTQFLELLGQKIKLNGFTDFRGGLDVKTDSTGTESVFTEFKGYKIMFHVSTLLPFTPNNSQQLLRKRHIGNDITTIVFQEPGSEPFNPKHIRSHFQHIFVIVRVHNPCSENTCYSVAVTRSRNIPQFGPPIPENSMFPISSTFREFLLTKVINAENTAHTAGKFKALAMNTKEQYLRDLAANNSTQNGLEGTPRFGGRFSISAASRRIKDRDKDKQKAKPMPETYSRGALTWRVTVKDYSNGDIVSCILGMSDCVLSIIETDTKQLIFSIPCQAILGWTVPAPNAEQRANNTRDLHIYYGRGEQLTLHTDESEARDEIILRLEHFTKGSETVYRQLRRNVNGQLGFHVNYEGVVMEVEPEGCAAMDGLKQSSRLVEICKVAVATMTHEEIIDLLRTSERVKVVVIPPNEDGTPRKCSMELYHLYPVLDVKKVNLSTLTVPLDLAHERSRSEPIRKPSNEMYANNRRISDEMITINVPTHYRDENEKILSIDTTQKSKHKAHHSKKPSGIKAGALIATGLALDSLSGHHQAQPFNTTLSTKSPTSSNHNNHNGVDVNLTEGKNRGGSQRSHNSISSDSGLNSNNNSSYSISQSKYLVNPSTTSNQNLVRADSWNTKYAQHNLNNNNSTPVTRSSFTSRDKRVKNDLPIKGVYWNTPRTAQEHSYSVECTPTSEVNKSLKVYIANTEAHQKAKLNQTRSCDTAASHSQTRSEPVRSTPVKWKDQPLIASRSISEMTRKPITPGRLYVSSPKSKRRVTDIPSAVSRLKGSSRGRASPSTAPTTPNATSNDVQSSLIRLLTADSPTKPVPAKRSSRKSPVRTMSYRSSPKRQQSPTRQLSSKTYPLHRTVSDESLCGARADDVIMARQGSQDLDSGFEFCNHKASGSMDSLAPFNGKHVQYDTSPNRRLSPLGQAAFPLPINSDWDRLLDAAKAAEVFEASSIKSVSMGTLNDLNDAGHNLSYPLNWNRNNNQRTMSVEQLYDHEYRGNQGDPSRLFKSRDTFVSLRNPYSEHPMALQPHLMMSRSLQMTPNESELRLEKIERQMRELQEKLKQEQVSKKALESEVSSLRRDNTRLLKHVRSAKPGLVNGFKSSKRKHKS